MPPDADLLARLDALAELLPLLSRALDSREVFPHLSRMAGRVLSHDARPLLALNCAPLPKALIEPEPFGHEKCAFTGPTHARSGLIERVADGVLLLDEVGEPSPGAPARLLRRPVRKETAMSQAHREQAIGRLATDEQWRALYRRARAEALDARTAAASLDLTATDRQALLELAPVSLERFARAFDPRRQRLGVAR